MPLPKLPTVSCPHCERVVTVSDNQIRSGTAREYKDCIRRCEPCGIAASNTRRAGAERWIFRDPVKNIPAESREHVTAVLECAFNKRNRQSRLAKFAFSTSEDAVTWVIFSYLVRSGRLGEALR